MKQNKKNQDYSRVQLHFHPFFNGYALKDVINAAGKKDIEFLALERLNEITFPELIGMSKMLPNYYKTEHDNSILKVSNKTNNKSIYLPKAIELDTKENFHLIIIGDSKVKPFSPIEKAIETALENDCLVIFDHPFVDNSDLKNSITKTKEKEVERICKKYSNHICLEWNAYCIPWVRHAMFGRDVNKQAERLSTKLKNVPVITDSDIHARYKWALNEMDKGIIKIKKIKSNQTGKEIIASLKKDIMGSNYENTKTYASFPHFVFNLGLPYAFEYKLKGLFKGLYGKPRA